MSLQTYILSRSHSESFMVLKDDSLCHENYTNLTIFKSRMLLDSSLNLCAACCQLLLGSLWKAKESKNGALDLLFGGACNELCVA